MLRLIFSIFVASFLPGTVPFSSAQQALEEKVVVTANAYPVPFENLSRAVSVFTREDIGRLPVHSIADLLALSASVDLRSRSPFGSQADISIRGSAFSQTLVLVDGIRINDSQTGHHNSDFPVQVQDIERVEVLLGPGSSIYGADAFGGIVNIITRRSAETLQASFSGGQHGFLQASVSTGFRKGILDQSFSVTGSRSSGFQYDRDFRNLAVSARTGLGNNSSFFVSHLNKEFGANGFYGPSPSREWTNQTFVSVEHRSSGRKMGNAVVQGFYRTHGDRFLYDERSPGIFESTHRTQSAGAIARTQIPLQIMGSLTLGGELGGDWIASSSLGDHRFGRTSLFSELQWNFGKTAVLYPGIRFDYYSHFGSSASPSMSGSWWMLPRVRIRASAGRAFRIPTFTELYYRDPNHQASAALKPERAWSEELGTDFLPARNWLASITFFSRQEQNVIDWIRSSALEKWRTSNLRDLHTVGAELGFERSFGSEAGIAVHYSRISTHAGNVDYISKYVLDYARDSWTGSAFFPVLNAIACKQTLSYRRRADGRSYWVLDGGLEHHFRFFTAGIDFTNLLDSRYQEVSGVDMPGRWFAFTMRTR